MKRRLNHNGQNSQQLLAMHYDDIDEDNVDNDEDANDDGNSFYDISNWVEP
jgi:hypothetical protein